MDPRELLHGLTPHAIAERFDVSLSTARRWKKSGRMPHLALRFARLTIAGDLGQLCTAWQGWKVLRKKIVSPEGFEVSTGEIRAIPVRVAQVRALELERATPLQRALF